MLSYFVFGTKGLLTVNAHAFQCMISETLGTFIIVLVYLTQTEPRSKLSSDAAMTTMLISASYVTSLAIAWTNNWSMSPLNPAIALGQITAITISTRANELSWAWIFLTFGWLGSLLAVLCFEMGFKKA